MWIIKGIAFIIFATNITKIDCDEKNSVTFTFKQTEFNVSSNNKYIEKKGDDSIVWKEDVNTDSNIRVYLISTMFEDKMPREVGSLCRKIDGTLEEILEFFLANGKPCPIKKETTSSLNREFKINSKKPEGTNCEPENGTLILYDVKDNLVILDLNIATTTSGEACS